MAHLFSQQAQSYKQRFGEFVLFTVTDRLSPPAARRSDSL